MENKKPVGSYILSILNSVLPPLFIIIIGGGLVLEDSDTGVKIGFLELYHSSVIGGLWLCCALSLAYYLGIRKNWLHPRWWTNLVIVILGFLMIPLVTLIVGSADVAPAAKYVSGKLSQTAKTETVQRWMSKAELKATKETGLVRGGRGGKHYATDSANKSATRARQRSALEQTPEVRATLEVPAGKFSKPSTVKPKYSMPGGGAERTARGKVPAKVIKVDGDK